MKWNITQRYLLSILSIVFIVFIINTLILFAFIYNQNQQLNNNSDSISGEDFTRSFQKYFEVVNDNIFVSLPGKKALTQFGAWLQILDKNGNVTYSYQAPNDATDHYSPFELIHKYKYMDDNFNTYFIGEFENYSYLVVVPNSQETRSVIMLNVKRILITTIKLFSTIFIINLLVATIVGFLFSIILTKPINTMVNRIYSLKERVFETENPKRPGIYKNVFENLNDVAETLNIYEQERQKTEKVRNEWISNISHDIKTPLSAIQGYAELLQNKDISDLEYLKYTEVIERQSLYIRDLLDDFNLTTRLRNKDLDFQLEHTNMERFIREIIIDLLNDPQFRTKHINFDSTLSLYWSIDQHLMKRALLNFIYNALLHNDDNTKVEVQMTDKEVIITDNGKGIPIEEQKQIFDRYYRGTNTGNIHGSGLGMAISRDIIVAHGGCVQLTSEINKGTTIKIKMNA